MICPNCKRENSDEHLFCGYCGSRLENLNTKDDLENELNKTINKNQSKKFCKKCGKEITFNTDFCPFCGEETKEEKSSSYIICSHCGESNSIDKTHCSLCGKSLYAENVEKEVNKTQEVSKKGLIFGIISAGVSVVGFFAIYFGQIASIVLGILAIVFSSKGLKKNKKNKNLITGLILGIVGIVISILFIIVWVKVFINMDYNFIIDDFYQGEDMAIMFLK